MTFGQILSFLVTALAVALFFAGIGLGLVYWVAPFYVSVAGYPLLPPASLSWSSFFTGGLVAFIGAATGFFALSVHQYFVDVLVAFEKGRIAFCAEEIGRTFGTDAERHWRDERESILLKQFQRNAGAATS